MAYESDYNVNVTAGSSQTSSQLTSSSDHLGSTPNSAVNEIANGKLKPEADLGYRDRVQHALAEQGGLRGVRTDESQLPAASVAEAQGRTAACSGTRCTRTRMWVGLRWRGRTRRRYKRRTSRPTTRIATWRIRS